MCQIVKTMTIENILYGRIKGNYNDLSNFHKRFEQTIVDSGAENINGSIKRVNRSEIINGEHIIDIEVWAPINKKIRGTEEFKFLDQFILNDFILVEHIGSPEESERTIEKLNTYIVENRLQPLPPAYNHSLYVASKDIRKEDMKFRIYLQIVCL